MKKATTIHILPELTADMSHEEFNARYWANRELAATIDYIPDSLETLRKIDYTEMKMLMDENENFFNATVELCGDLIEDQIRVEKKVATEMFENGEINEEDYKAIQAVVTLDDLLNCGCYGDDYDDSRDEFVTVFVEDHLYGDSFQWTDDNTENEERVEEPTECNVEMGVMNALLIVAMHRDELFTDMPLGDFLDWLDEKSKTEDYTSQVIEALQKKDYLIR